MSKRCLMLTVLILTICLFCGAERAKADDLKSVDDASPQEIMDGMANKLARGMANITTGWLEIPKQVRITSNEEGWTKGLTVGQFKGIGMAVTRTVSGVAETLTFFVAYPGFYDPLFDPPYVWQKE